MENVECMYYYEQFVNKTWEVEQNGR